MSSQKPKRLTGGKRSKTEQKRVDRKKGNKNPLLNQTTTRQKKIVGHGMLPNKALPGHNTHTHTTHSQTHPANKRTPGFKKSSSNYVSTPHTYKARKEYESKRFRAHPPPSTRLLHLSFHSVHILVCKCVLLLLSALAPPFVRASCDFASFFLVG